MTIKIVFYSTTLQFWKSNRVDKYVVDGNRVGSSRVDFYD